MTLLARLIRGAPVVLLCASLSGCVPSGQSELEEEKEPHFLEGKACFNNMDFRGAIEKFEQTLEANPHHAKAHLELGCLFEEKEPDPAAAIYHYEQYLKLRANAENAEFIRQRITNCKQDLAKTVLLPIAPSGMQRQFEQLADENKRLRDELDQLKAYYAAHPPSQPGQAPASAPPAQPQLPAQPPADPGASASGAGARASAPPAAPRTHTVQSGDTPYSIARKYGIKLDALMAANPGLDARRLKVGQTVNVPQP